MQITGKQGYKCPYCKCAVHEDVSLVLKHINCPYCDVPMIQYKRVSPAQEINFQIYSEECKDDCDRMTLNLEDIEDEPTMSDDEECIHKICPNLEDIDISDLSSDEDDVADIFSKELEWMKYYFPERNVDSTPLACQELDKMETE